MNELPKIYLEFFKKVKEWRKIEQDGIDEIVRGYSLQESEDMMGDVLKSWNDTVGIQERMIMNETIQEKCGSATCFHCIQDLVVFGTEKGHLMMYRRGEQKRQFRFDCILKSPCQDVRCTTVKLWKKRLFCGYSNGVVAEWSLNPIEIINEIVNEIGGAVKNICIAHENLVIVSDDKGCIKYFSRSKGGFRVVKKFRNKDSQDYFEIRSKSNGSDFCLSLCSRRRILVMRLIREKLSNHTILFENRIKNRSSPAFVEMSKYSQELAFGLSQLVSVYSIGAEKLSHLLSYNFPDYENILYLGWIANGLLCVIVCRTSKDLRQLRIYFLHIDRCIGIGVTNASVDGKIGDDEIPVATEIIDLNYPIFDDTAFAFYGITHLNAFIVFNNQMYQLYLNDWKIKMRNAYRERNWSSLFDMGKTFYSKDSNQFMIDLDRCTPEDRRLSVRQEVSYYIAQFMQELSINGNDIDQKDKVAELFRISVTVEDYSLLQTKIKDLFHSLGMDNTYWSMLLDSLSKGLIDTLTEGTIGEILLRFRDDSKIVDSLCNIKVLPMNVTSSIIELATERSSPKLLIHAHKCQNTIMKAVEYLLLQPKCENHLINLFSETSSIEKLMMMKFFISNLDRLKPLYMIGPKIISDSLISYFEKKKNWKEMKKLLNYFDKDNSQDQLYILKWNSDPACLDIMAMEVNYVLSQMILSCRENQTEQKEVEKLLVYVLRLPIKSDSCLYRSHFISRKSKQDYILNLIPFLKISFETAKLQHLAKREQLLPVVIELLKHSDQENEFENCMSRIGIEGTSIEDIHYDVGILLTYPEKRERVVEGIKRKIFQTTSLHEKVNLYLTIHRYFQTIMKNGMEKTFGLKTDIPFFQEYINAGKFLVQNYNPSFESIVEHDIRCHLSKIPLETGIEWVKDFPIASAYLYAQKKDSLSLCQCILKLLQNRYSQLQSSLQQFGNEIEDEILFLLENQGKQINQQIHKDGSHLVTDQFAHFFSSLQSHGRSFLPKTMLNQNIIRISHGTELNEGFEQLFQSVVSDQSPDFLPQFPLIQNDFIDSLRLIKEYDLILNERYRLEIIGWIYGRIDQLLLFLTKNGSTLEKSDQSTSMMTSLWMLYILFKFAHQTTKFYLFKSTINSVDLIDRLPTFEIIQKLMLQQIVSHLESIEDLWVSLERIHTEELLENVDHMYETLFNNFALNSSSRNGETF